MDYIPSGLSCVKKSGSEIPGLVADVSLDLLFHRLLVTFWYKVRLKSHIGDTSLRNVL